MFLSAVSGNGTEDQNAFPLSRWDERWRFKLAGADTVAPRLKGLQGREELEDIDTVRPSVPGEVSPDLVLNKDFPELPN